ncbi:MAG TPA: GatB/YqeY domain-containing protein [Candidatus Polarisedimenticolaceae bacterium]|nr:GatB/YqeY domain-containing protein [Candidatus Polarisedimenticolaceae bacterium]
MKIRERIVADLTAAMKAKDTLRLGVVRMLKSKIMEAEVEQRTRKGPDYVLEDAESLAVIAAYAKQRRDSIEAFRNGGKEDLATKEEAELAIVQQYLPAQMSDDEVRRIVAAAIAETGATSAKEMGAIMKIVMPKLKGAADGAVVNRIVRELLA